MRTKNIRAFLPDGRSWAEFRADGPSRGKGQRAMVFLYLGTEPFDGDGETINPNEWLKARGWTPPPRQEPDWSGVSAETRRAAEEARRAHENGEAKGPTIGGIKHSEVRLDAEALGCDGVQLRSVGAKKNREPLERALRNCGLVLDFVKFEKEGRRTILLLGIA